MRSMPLMPGTAPPFSAGSNLATLVGYWTDKSQALGHMPARRDVDPADLVPILPYVFLLDIVPHNSARRFRYRLTGTAHYDKNGREITGKFLEDAFDDAEVVKKLAMDNTDCIETCRPVYRMTRIALPDRSHLLYERIICPLSDDGDLVDMLIGVVHYLE